MKLKNVEAITLDYSAFSEEAFEEFKRALEDFGLYLGDLLNDYYQDENGNGSDTYCLYIAKRQLKPKEIKEMFGGPLGIDDDQGELFDLNEFREH